MYIKYIRTHAYPRIYNNIYSNIGKRNCDKQSYV